MQAGKIAMLCLTAGLLFNGGAEAASAVAFDSQTGTYAWRYGDPNLRQAEALALRGCRSRGGRSCTIITSCNQGGYGFIYRRRLPGRPLEAIGASCGYASVGRANDAAKAACNARLPRRAGCGVGSRWYDPVNDGHVPARCKNRQPFNDPCYR